MYIAETFFTDTAKKRTISSFLSPLSLPPSLLLLYCTVLRTYLIRRYLPPSLFFFYHLQNHIHVRVHSWTIIILLLLFSTLNILPPSLLCRNLSSHPRESLIIIPFINSCNIILLIQVLLEITLEISIIIPLD